MEKRTVSIQRNAIENFFMAIKDYSKKHRKGVIIGVFAIIILAGLVIGGGIYAEYRTRSELVRYERIMSEYESGAKDAGAFQSTVKKIISLTEESMWGYIHNYGYYIVAGMYFDRRMYNEARENYEKYVNYSSKSAFTPLANFQIAVCLEQTGHFDRAFEIYKKMEKSYKDTNYFDKVLYDLGRMYVKKGDQVSAREYFSKVITQYPNSQYVAQAKIRLFMIGL